MTQSGSFSTSFSPTSFTIAIEVVEVGNPTGGGKGSSHHQTRTSHSLSPRRLIQ